MNIGKYKILGNRHGITIYQMTRAGLFNEQTVPDAYVSLHFKCYPLKPITHRVGHFYARSITLGPVTVGLISYHAPAQKKRNLSRIWTAIGGTFQR